MSDRLHTRVSVLVYVGVGSALMWLRLLLIVAVSVNDVAVLDP
jgi:hypothetical protein